MVLETVIAHVSYTIQKRTFFNIILCLITFATHCDISMSTQFPIIQHPDALVARCPDVFKYMRGCAQQLHIVCM